MEKLVDLQGTQQKSINISHNPSRDGVFMAPTTQVVYCLPAKLPQTSPHVIDDSVEMKKESSEATSAAKKKVKLIFSLLSFICYMNKAGLWVD